MSIFEHSFNLGDLLVRLPIIQGGMGVKISASSLASAVANEGGVGTIAAADIGMDEEDFFKDPSGANVRALRDEIQKARKMTDGILGINIMVALTDFAILVRTAIEEKIDVIFSGAGLPLNLPNFLQKGSKTKLVPIVSSARAAKILVHKWMRGFGYFPDAFVVEGPKAGGHLGFKVDQINDPDFSLEKLVQQVVEILRPIEEKFKKSIPVIAAGGIFTGADIFKFFQLGAAGVQMATRFVATHECDADIRFKQAYIDAKEEDIKIIKSPVGMPGRALWNGFLEKVSQGKKIPFKCPYECLKTCKVGESPFCISLALMNAQRGRTKQGFVFCGANAHLVKKIVSVRELINSLTAEFKIAFDSS